MNRRIASVGLVVGLVVLLTMTGLVAGIVVGQDNPGDQTEEPLPVGLALSSQMQDLVAERLERIHELILDHKLMKAEQHEAKLQLILEHHEMVQEKIREWQQEFQSLVQRFESGEISQAEFKVERERLRSRIRETERLFTHLGQRLQEQLRGSQGNATDLGQRVSEVNREIAERIRELRSELRVERKASGNPGHGQGKGNRRG